MTETPITAETADGVADGKLFTPDAKAGGASRSEVGGPWPLVVQYHDAGGLRPVFSGMAEPLTSAGYAVLQPNLYWRSGPFAPFDPKTAFVDPNERARLFALLHAVKPAQVVADTAALLGQLDGRVRTDRIGVVGYCMGGRMAFVVATAMPDRVVAAGCIHAGGLVSDAPDSPHRDAGKIRARVYLAVAENDNTCTPDHQRALREALDAAGVRYEMESFAARHGWAMPDFPVYDAAAAAKQWERVLALYSETLA